MNFKLNSFYKHKRFKDLVIQVLSMQSPHLYKIAYFTLGYDPKKPVFLGFSKAYSIDNIEDWSEVDPIR